MLYVYLVVSAVLVLIGNALFEVLRQSWSWWGVPLIFIGNFLILVILHIGLALLSIQLIDIKSKPEKGTGFYRWLIKITLPMIVKFAGVKINSFGVEKVPDNTRFMLICNHQHDFDPAIIYHELPDAEISFIGKKDILTEMPFVAKAMHKLRCMFIDRENNREGAKTIVNAVKLIKSNEASVAIFPEGYTSPSCELLPFRSGAFKIAYKANVPIVVCVLNNTRSIVPNLLRRKTVVDFRVLDVIYPEQFKDLHTVELAEKIHSQMDGVIRELKNEKV